MFSKTLFHKPNPKDIQLGFKTKVLKYSCAQKDQVHLDSSYTTIELNYYTQKRKTKNKKTKKKKKTIHSNKRESQISCHL